MAPLSTGSSTTHQHTWDPPLTKELKEHALALARELGERIADVEECKRIADEASVRIGVDRYHQWSPINISSGPLSTALFLDQLDRVFPDDGWSNIAHEHLQCAIDELNFCPSERQTLGLYSGLCGLMFAALRLSRGGARYTRLCNELNAVLVQQLGSAPLLTLPLPELLRPSAYDLITGLVGWGVLSIAADANYPDTEWRHLCEHIMSLLVLRSRMPIQDGVMTGFQCDYEHDPEPAGLGSNSGIAHGISGVLAFLSIAKRQSITVPHIDDAISRLTSWLLSVGDSGSWPGKVVAQPSGSTTSPGLDRNAWCYGRFGVSAALLLASQACGNEAVRAAGISAITATAATERPEPSAIICHGTAGQLLVTLRYLKSDPCDATLQSIGNKLLQRLLSDFSADLPLGYTDLLHTGVRVSTIGFLDGVSGIGLSLLATSAAEPDWDRLLLLS